MKSSVAEFKTSSFNNSEAYTDFTESIDTLSPEEHDSTVDLTIIRASLTTQKVICARSDILEEWYAHSVVIWKDDEILHEHHDPPLAFSTIIANHASYNGISSSCYSWTKNSNFDRVSKITPKNAYSDSFCKIL